jgi:hypothetical protein
MDEETLRKEALAAAFAKKLYAMKEMMNVPPIDVGDGWRKLYLPPVPAFANASSYQKDCIDLGFLNLIIERRTLGQDDATLFPTGRWHLSISHNYPTAPGKENQPGRYPTWDEIKQARYKFLPGDVNMAIMFPPESMYYNRHSTCLHLLEVPVGLAIDLRQRGGI